ncbi:hypothetical protein GCM10010112_90410 [Actinoplanes lobatus]|uniref:Uncharacterized protein n=1 Tax=Actinoplanes lobatus TaxID=113568 RepID=A0ABQ4AXP7_9ACTN|nr:hypothetical protein GCM10010112_90410 [Actinoplanes lobatus]GIE45799.1 hypothetical protein Alo02nite_86970 [Actinoplanes lobatus]
MSTARLLLSCHTSGTVDTGSRKQTPQPEGSSPSNPGLDRFEHESASLLTAGACSGDVSTFGVKMRHRTGSGWTRDLVEYSVNRPQARRRTVCVKYLYSRSAANSVLASGDGHRDAQTDQGEPTDTADQGKPSW